MGLKKSIRAALLILPVAACGGGAGITTPVGGNLSGLPIFDPAQSSTPQTLSVVGIDSGSRAVVRQSPTLTGTSISSGILAGTVDLGNSRINLATGGSGPLTTTGGVDQQFGFSTGSHFGVAGLASPINPGSATYRGRLRAFIDDGTVAETLSGSMTANLSGGTGLAVNADTITSANRSGSLAITSAQVNGTRISGGSLSLTGNFATLPTSGTVTHAGQFFGPNGTEVGGAFLLDQTSGGNRIFITGTYAGD